MSSFVLREFWERTTTPIYNIVTGELIDGKVMKANRHLEVDYFDFYKDGIGVKLESEDEE